MKWIRARIRWGLAAMLARLLSRHWDNVIVIVTPAGWSIITDLDNEQAYEVQRKAIAMSQMNRLIEHMADLDHVKHWKNWEAEK